MAYVKPAVASKTVWFNVLTTVGTVLSTIGGVLPPPILPYVVLISGVVNIGLRFMTDTGIKVK